MTKVRYLLALVVEHRRLSLGEAAEAMGVTKQRASELAKRLTVTGMVTKHADPLNGHAIYLRPTKAGRHRILHPTEYGDE